MLRTASFRYVAGTSLIEVLVTLIILAIGLLGVAALQSKMGTTEIDSYQRQQALLALADMTNRMQANSPQAASYVTTSPVGTGDSEPASCAGLAVGEPLDECQWSHLLKGTGEQTQSGYTGAMLGGRGCITQIQPANPAQGVCTAGLYQITVAWQGTTAEPSPTLACGQGLYGGSNGMSYRRVVSSIVSVPTLSCY